MSSVVNSVERKADVMIFYSLDHRMADSIYV